MSLECVICRKQVERTALLSHISAHFNYFPHVCLHCHFRGTDQNDCIEHEVGTGHSVQLDKDFNRYMKLIQVNAFKDCILAAEKGYDAVFKQGARDSDSSAMRMNNAVENESDDEVEDILPKSSNRWSKNIKQSEQASGTVVQNQLDDPSAKTSKAKKIKVVAAPADSSNQMAITGASSNSRLDEKEGCLTAKEIAVIDKEINRGYVTLPCKKCKFVCVNDYKSQKEHVLKNHPEWRNSDDKEGCMSSLVRSCFPTAVATNDFQCGICGEEMKSSGGRMSHINKEHLFYTLRCPKAGCAFETLCESSVATHLRNKHAVSLDALEGNEETAYARGKKILENKVKPYLMRCFPFPLPRGGDKLEKEALSDFIANELVRNVRQQSPARIAPSNRKSSSSNLSEDDSDAEGTKVDSIARKPAGGELQNKETQNPAIEPITLSDDEEKEVPKKWQNGLWEDSTRLSATRFVTPVNTGRHAPPHRTRSHINVRRDQSSSRHHGKPLNKQEGISPIRSSEGRKSPTRHSAGNRRPISRFNDSRDSLHQDVGRAGEKRAHEKSPSPLEDRYQPKALSRSGGLCKVQHFSVPTVDQPPSSDKIDTRKKWSSGNGDLINKQNSREDPSPSIFPGTPNSGKLRSDQAAKNQSSHQRSIEGVPSQFFFPPPQSRKPESNQKREFPAHSVDQKTAPGFGNSEFEIRSERLQKAYGSMPTAKSGGLDRRSSHRNEALPTEGSGKEDKKTF